MIPIFGSDVWNGLDTQQHARRTVAAGRHGLEDARRPSSAHAGGGLTVGVCAFSAE
jgi:hypothetical protein